MHLSSLGTLAARLVGEGSLSGPAGKMRLVAVLLRESYFG